MFLRSVFLIVVLAVLIVWVDYLNPGDVLVRLPGGFQTDASKIAIMLGSAVFGMLVVLLGLYIKATGEYFRNWKASRKRQKEEKIQSLYSKGLNSMLSRRNDVASTYFEKVLAIQPNHAETLLRLGSIYQKNGDNAEAIKLHQRARNIEESNIEVLFSLARDYEDARRTEDALQTLEDILRKDEGNLRALTRIREINMKQGEFEKADTAQERVLKLSLPPKEQDMEQKRLVGIKYETGRVALEDGNIEKAKKVFKSVVKLDKNFVPAYLGLGEVYLEENENVEAAELWEEAYKATGSIIFLHRLEDLYLKIGTPGKIINLYKSALLATPNDPTLSFFLGKLYYRLEMVDEAFDTLTNIDSSTRQFTDLHKLLGNLYLRRAMKSEAVEEFKKALAFSSQLIVPYRCGTCDHFQTEWAGRCPRCGRWDTFAIDLDKYC